MKQSLPATGIVSSPGPALAAPGRQAQVSVAQRSRRAPRNDNFYLFLRLTLTRFLIDSLHCGLQTVTSIWVCILVFTLSSCTLRQSLQPTVSSTISDISKESGVPTAEQLLAPLRSRQQHLTSLRGLARVTYNDSEEKGTARQAVAVVAPDHFRVELFSPIGIAALVTTDGQRLAAYFPKEKTIYRGAANAENAARFLRIMLSAGDIASLLSGLPFSIPHEENSTVRFEADHNWYVLSVPEEGGSSQTLIFDAQKATPAQMGEH